MEPNHLTTEGTSATVTPAERIYAVTTLHDTLAALKQALAGLTVDQQRFKPAPDRWSILENAEHIMLVERGIFYTLQQNMQLPEDPQKRESIRVTDIGVIKAVRSRGMAIPAPAAFKPTGRFATVEEAYAAVEKLRHSAITYLETTPENLRTHYFEHMVLGTLDTYQAMLLLASHGERHRKQIEEVKASEGYPA